MNAVPPELMETLNKCMMNLVSTAGVVQAVGHIIGCGTEHVAVTAVHLWELPLHDVAVGLHEIGTSGNKEHAVFKLKRERVVAADRPTQDVVYSRLGGLHGGPREHPHAV